MGLEGCLAEEIREAGPLWPRKPNIDSVSSSDNGRHRHLAVAEKSTEPNGQGQQSRHPQGHKDDKGAGGTSLVTWVQSWNERGQNWIHMVVFRPPPVSCAHTNDKHFLKFSLKFIHFILLARVFCLYLCLCVNACDSCCVSEQARRGHQIHVGAGNWTCTF